MSDFVSRPSKNFVYIEPCIGVMDGSIMIISGIISWMRQANEIRIRRYIVTPSLIGWAQTQNDPWICVFQAHEELAYLPVGTEVSAKYRGAFCEAKVKKLVRLVKCKVGIRASKN